MKKLMALALALVLCVCTAAACAETTVQEKVIEAYNLELNTKADMLILTDRETGRQQGQRGIRLCFLQRGILYRGERGPEDGPGG